MAKKSKKSKSSKQSSKGGAQWLYVDPACVRFQHSRIRPYFSGCGRSVHDTLKAIRNKELAPSDLPPIQVIVGPEDDEGPWYFSLNNRRLWVLKQCREEGLLENNLIRVRVRQPKSGSEEERYTLENCAVEAKFIREKDPKQNERKESSVLIDSDRASSEGQQQTSKHGNELAESCLDTQSRVSEEGDIPGNMRQDPNEDSSSSESEDSFVSGAISNRFSALM